MESRNLKDYLRINDKKVDLLGNYILEKYLNCKADEKFNFSYETQYDFSKNINFSLDYFENNTEKSLVFCEWYDEKNLDSELEAFLEDRNSTKLKKLPVVFIFLTKQELITKIMTESNNSVSKIGFKFILIDIQDILDWLGIEK